MMEGSLKRPLLALLALAAATLVSCGMSRPGAYPGGGSAGPERVEGGIRFTLHYPKADRVSIAGDFNGWSPGVDRLFDREATGLWSIVLPLQPGRYEYKFVVNGEKWISDPQNAERVKDGFGGYNSVVIVAP